MNSPATLSHPSAQRVTPAHLVISKCGGPSTLARVLGLPASTVYRWLYPVTKGGTGGYIPRSRHADIMEYAKMMGIDLRVEDFF